jgi:hypothetical protein
MVGVVVLRFGRELTEVGAGGFFRVTHCISRAVCPNWALKLHDFAPPQFTISKPLTRNPMDSPSNTEPDFITWELVRQLLNNRDFARLILTSHLARNNFNHLVSRLKDDPLLYSHARRIIHYEPVAFDDETSATNRSCTKTKQETA